MRFSKRALIIFLLSVILLSPLAMASEEMVDIEITPELMNQAVIFYQSSLDEAKDSGNKSAQADALAGLGAIYTYQKENKKAETVLTEAVKIFSELNDEKKLLASAHQLLLLYYTNGDFEKALILHNRIKTKTAEAVSQEKFEEISMAISSISALGQFDRALEEIASARAIAGKIGDPKLRFRLDSMESSIYMSSNEHDRSIYLLEKSIADLEKICPDKSACSDNNSPAFWYFPLYVNLGMSYEKAGYPEKAITAYKNAISEELKNSTSYKLTGFIEAFLIARIYDSMGNKPEAERYYRLALDLSGKTRAEFAKLSKIGSPIPEIELIINLSDIVSYAGLEDFENAEISEAKFNEIISSFKIYSEYWIHYAAIAITYEMHGKPEKAVANYLKAVNLIEDALGNIKTSELKSSYLEASMPGMDKAEVYEHLINLLIKQGKSGKAFGYLEKSKARALLDMVLQGNVNIKKGADALLIDKEKKLSSEIKRLVVAVSIEERKSPTQIRGDFVERTSADIATLKKEYIDVIDKIRLQNSELADLKSAKPADTNEIRAMIPQDSAMLEYAIGKDSAYLFVIDSKNFNVIDLKSSSKNIYDIVSRVRRQLSSPDNDESTIKSSMKSLYAILLKPAENYIKDKKTLIISPSGMLHALPFSALADENGNYLINKYSIVNEPSASTMCICRKKERANDNSLSAFALGNLTMSAAGKKINPLPGTKKEVESIAKLFDKKKTYYEKNVTIDNLKKSSKSSLLHIATHGVLDSNSPMFSGLIMADGYLTAAEVFNIPVESSLVTLSACQTGLGRISGGDEVVGLSRAFFYAGTPSIIASMWTVSDESTALLMGEFYKNLKTMSKSEALQAAQIKIMEKYPHPFYWAPFVLIGDWK